MAVNKNFVIKNGLEVNNNLIFADANSNKVGIATTNVQYTLDVNGGIGASSVYVKYDLEIDGRISAGNTFGNVGSYLVSTGTGVTWSQSSGIRNTQNYTAELNQTVFSFLYSPALGVDVFINGVRLTSTDYTATTGNSVVLNTGCFAGDSVDLIGYSLDPSSGDGLIVLDEGTSIGNDGNIKSLNFVGAAVSTSLNGYEAVITISGSGSDVGVSSNGTLIGTATTLNFIGAAISSVTISSGTANIEFSSGSGPGLGSSSSLTIREVNTYTASLNQTTFSVDYSIGYVDVFLNGSKLSQTQYTATNGTSITLNEGASDGDIVEVIGYNTSGTTGGTTASSSHWIKNTVGIHTFSNVGIGTTNPTEKLTVFGDARVTGILTIGTASITLDGTNNEIKIGSGVTIYGDTGAISLNGSQFYTSVSSSSVYNQIGTLTGSLATQSSDYFGFSVATSADGKTIVVGAYPDEIGATVDTGVVYVFDRVGNSFNQVGILTGTYAIDTNDYFGYSVATSADGSTIVVGAIYDEVDATPSTGVVYVFDRVGNSFNQVGILTGSFATETGDRFGFTVATSSDGNTIVVGAFNDEIGETTGTGVVYVFDRVGNSFNQVGILTGSFATETGDSFGGSVAISADGSTIVVGADYDEISTEEDSGVAYVFDRVGNSFNQVGILTGSLASAYDYSGWPVSISADGKTIVVCAGSDEIGATSETGVVYVFDRVGNSFNQVGILTGSYSIDANDFFGSSVATSADGKTIVVGARYDEAPNTEEASGVAYVFKRVGNSFNQVGILISPFPPNDTYNEFGVSVAISADGKTIVVGAYGDETGGPWNTGAAYVFDEMTETYVTGDTKIIGSVTANKFIGDGSELTDLRINLPGTHLVSYASASDISNSSLSISGISTYKQVGILTGSLSDANDSFGYSLAASADSKTIVVGAVYDEIGTTESTGLVYVFDRSGNSFNQVGILTGSFAKNSSDWFGGSVDISADGKTIVVGADFDEQNSTTLNSGLAYVFERVGNSFNQVGILTGSYSIDANDYFGWPVKISADGNTIVVSATSDEIGATTGTGVVYVFERVGNSFNPVGILTGSLAGANDNFGYSVATSSDGKTIVVGVPDDEIGATTGTGVVYVFDRVGNSFNQVGILTGSLATNADDVFGWSVATSADGKTIVVGAPYDEVGATADTGVVYVFDRVGNSFNQVGILTGSLAIHGYIYNPLIGYTNDVFGRCVNVSADGNTIVVGAPGDEESPTGSPANTGIVYIFKREGNTFNQVKYITHPAPGFNLGESLAISADGKTISATVFSNTTTNTGAVYVFDEIRETYLYSTPSGNIGIGTTNPTSKLTVSGTVSATSFVGDGSGLTGLVGTSTGVGISSNGTPVGTANTINFTGSGISTITVSSNVATINILGSSGTDISPVMMSMIF